MAFAAVQNQVPPLAWLIFVANVFWTLAYDTIYAMVDKEDDLKINIKTSAITFGQHDVAAVMFCHTWFTLLMGLVGWLIGAAWPYWLSLLLVVYGQYCQYRIIAQRDRWQCFHAFLSNNRIGFALFAGLVLHYAWAA